MIEDDLGAVPFRVQSEFPLLFDTTSTADWHRVAFGHDNKEVAEHVLDEARKVAFALFSLASRVAQAEIPGIARQRRAGDARCRDGRRARRAPTTPASSRLIIMPQKPVIHVLTRYKKSTINRRGRAGQPDTWLTRTKSSRVLLTTARAESRRHAAELRNLAASVGPPAASRRDRHWQPERRRCGGRSCPWLEDGIRPSRGHDGLGLRREGGARLHDINVGHGAVRPVVALDAGVRPCAVDDDVADGAGPYVQPLALVGARAASEKTLCSTVQSVEPSSG